MTAMGFPVFARGTCVYDSLNRQRVVDFDVPVQIDAVTFSPGDLVIADGDGVVIVPRSVERAALLRAWQKVRAEDAARQELQTGAKAQEVYRRSGVL